MLLPRRRHLLPALRSGGIPSCGTPQDWRRWVGVSEAMQANAAIELALQREAEARQCEPRSWCHPESLANPGATSERVRYQDKARRVLPQLPGQTRGDLVAGTWCVELSRLDAPSYCTTAVERAQTWLRVTWAGAGAAPIEITGTDPGTGRPWIGSVFPFPLVSPVNVLRTIRVRWVFVAQGEDTAANPWPLGPISPDALPESARVPACPSVVPDWDDNRRGFHRSVDREQHVVTNTPAVCRMFAVLDVTAEDPGTVVASVEVGARLQAVTVQQGPFNAGIRAAIVRS